MRSLISLLPLSILTFCSAAPLEKSAKILQWQHLTSEDGDIEVPNEGNQQTASLVVDLDMDGINDFVIAERTGTPSVVWYQRREGDWQRMVVDRDALRVEAGGVVYDIDQDGAPDLVFGGDAGGNELWSWENPAPNFEPEKPWVRRWIKAGGANKHHDQIFGDFDADGRTELVFWNQGANTLFLAEIPEDPHGALTWHYRAIYSYSDKEEPLQRGEYPSWKGTNEHEGLAASDIDGDLDLDILGKPYTWRSPRLDIWLNQRNRE